MSLWSSFTDTIQQIYENACTLRTLSNNVDAEITNPFTSHLKEMEQSRKNIVDEGLRHTSSLQDHFTALKKAKQLHEDTLQVFNETKEGHLRASRTSNIKEKEMDKWNQKLQQATEKVQSAELAYRQTDDTAKTAQIKYWQTKIPDILLQLHTKEEERCLIVMDAIKNWLFMEKQYADFSGKVSSYSIEKVNTVDITSDMSEIFQEHVAQLECDEVHKSNHGMENVSVMSLLNPLKAGRLLKKTDSGEGNWKTRYFVLIGDRGDPLETTYRASSGRLFYFESEDSLHPKGIIELAT
eukprot:Partr_v1_DN28685_c0_g1_i1_m50120